MSFTNRLRESHRRYRSEEDILKDEHLRKLSLLLDVKSINIDESSTQLKLVKEINKNWRNNFIEDATKILKLKRRKKCEKDLIKKLSIKNSKIQDKIDQTLEEIKEVEANTSLLNYKLKMAELKKTRTVKARTPVTKDDRFEKQMTKIYKRCMTVRGNEYFYKN
ncbi:unnamed protein product [Moneuplotes crassus]|uniref:Uncharacterized protein n=1 Tax=Euplotes crassus TaxID=5936 RepID=A0AAD1XU08_EUPCR|nr:unnamed protein product [Moneuplotes crassus]